MHIALFSRCLRLIVGMALCAIAVVLFAQAPTKENLRAELIRLQKETGLSLVSFGGGGGRGYLDVVMFASRRLTEKELLKENVGEAAMSLDGSAIAFGLHRETGSRLGIVRQDGSDLKEFPDLGDPYDPCWSLDKSALALTVKNLKRGKDATQSLQILNLGNGSTEEVDAKGYATSQCWSPDGKQIVYHADGTLRVYDMQEKKSRTLTNGWHPTWSPDGNWIAFAEDDGYYAIRPSGKEKRHLFKKKDALTPLWWSPDSRFVAYLSRNRFFEGSWWPPIEQGRLRVRRLDDNAEEWVANLYVEGHVPSFQWAKDMRLNSPAEQPR